MAWQDRSYYRDRSSGQTNPLMWLLSGSVPLFTAFGVRVRVHAMLLLMFALMLLTAGGAMGVRNTITFELILFISILAHEYGHCFAARSVGGEAKDILLWPLGGLAFADAPKRPWPQFVTVAGGPLVDVIICIIAMAGLALVNWGVPGVPLNPLSRHFYIPYDSTIGYYLWWFFIINWGLILFNALPIYPMDGGRLLQALLWFKIGYYRATIIACNIGLVGSVLMVMVGLPVFFSWQGAILVSLGVSCFMTCLSTRAATKAAGPWEEHDDGIDYSAAYDNSIGRPGRAAKKRSRWGAKRAAKKARRIALEERSERERIDAILAKVSAHGMHSLSWREKRTLRKATEAQRQREMEMSQVKWQ